MASNQPASGQTGSRRLVLHFDINNTILMSDRSKGLGTVENVSSLIIIFRYNGLYANQLGDV